MVWVDLCVSMSCRVFASEAGGSLLVLSSLGVDLAPSHLLGQLLGIHRDGAASRLVSE